MAAESAESDGFGTESDQLAVRELSGGDRAEGAGAPDVGR